MIRMQGRFQPKYGIMKQKKKENHEKIENFLISLHKSRVLNQKSIDKDIHTYKEYSITYIIIKYIDRCSICIYQCKVNIKITYLLIETRGSSSAHFHVIDNSRLPDGYNKATDASLLFSSNTNR